MAVPWLQALLDPSFLEAATSHLPSDPSFFSNTAPSNLLSSIFEATVSEISSGPRSILEASIPTSGPAVEPVSPADSYIDNEWKTMSDRDMESIASHQDDRNPESTAGITSLPAQDNCSHLAYQRSYSATRLFLGFLNCWSVNEVFGVTSCEPTRLGWLLSSSSIATELIDC